MKTDIRVYSHMKTRTKQPKQIHVVFLHFQVWYLFCLLVDLCCNINSYCNILSFYLDALVFLRTNLELLRPVVVGETVLFDCSTDDKSVTLNLLKRDNGSSIERILKVQCFFYTIQVSDRNYMQHVILSDNHNTLSIDLCQRCHRFMALI